MPKSCVCLFIDFSRSYTACNGLLGNRPVRTFVYVQSISRHYSVCFLQFLYLRFLDFQQHLFSSFLTSVWSISFAYISGIGMKIWSLIPWAREWDHNAKWGHVYPKLFLCASSFLTFYSPAPVLALPFFFSRPCICS